MRRSIVWVLGLTLLSAGCTPDVPADGPKDPKERVTEAAEPPAPAAGDMSGTTWTISYVDPVLGEESSYDITFRSGGELFDGDPNDTTPDNDNWEQVGPSVILYFNDAYATYTGEISAPGVLSGTATNVVDANWSWSAVLQN